MRVFRATNVLGMVALASTGCSTKIQQLSGFRSAVGFSTLTRDLPLVDFGDITVHAHSASRSVVFRNETVAGQGSGAVTCGSPTLEDPLDFQIDSSDCGGSLAVNGTCTVTVSAAPGTRGLLEGDLRLACSDALGSTQTISSRLRVNGVEIVLAVNPDQYDFGAVKVGTNSANQNFVFSNSGNLAATGCSAPVLSDNTNFTVVPGTCGTNDLIAGGSCTVAVHANPTVTGAASATLSRTCTVGGTIATLTNQVVVTGVTPVMAWNPLTYAFGNVPVGSNSATQTFTLSNTGGAAATGCSAPTISDATNFTIMTDLCGTSDLAALTGSCTVTVQANPTTAGAKSATLSRSCSYGGSVSTTANQITAFGATASLAWTPLTKDFGDVNVGSNSTTQTFTLTNSGTAAATGCSAPTIGDATNFSITADTCATNDLAASGGSCTVTVRGNPASAGAKATTLSRACAFGGTAATTSNQIVVNGVVALLAWSPLTKDFGNVSVGSNSTTQTFTLTNSGGSTATGCSAPTLTDATNFSIVTDNCGTANLAGSGGTCTVDVRANPGSMGAKSTTLSRACTFGGTATTTPNQIVALGTQVDLAFDQLTYDFGTVNVGANSANHVFTLQNLGNQAATGCAAPALSNATDFEIVSETCGTADVAASGSCTVTVRAIPQSSGAKATTLSRTCAVGGTPATTTNGLTTNAVQPSLAWSPMTKDFGNVNVGSNSSTQTFTLTNSGTATATGCSAPTLAGTDPSEFTIVTDNCGTATLAGSGATCTVDVRANPGSTGTKSATLSRTCTFGGTPTTTPNQIVVTGVAPSLVWSPLTKDFGNVNVGSNSSTQTFTLTNSGTATATGCSAPTLGGTNAGEFSIVTDNCGTANLAGSNATCTVDVRGHPSSAGTLTATLSRTCTFGGTASTTTDQIVVNGIAPSLVWSPLTKDFGNVNVGGSSALVFTLTNSGAAAATGCSAPTLTNSTDFTLANDLCGTADLAGSNATCTIQVRATPASAGIKTTTLSRTCTFGGVAATTTDQIVVNGQYPSLAWTPTTYDFGNVDVGANSSTHTFTLTNAGNGTATGCSAPVLGGSNASDFSIVTDNCGTANLAGSNTTCTVDVRANPGSIGAKGATLSRTCGFGGTASTTTDQIVATGVYPALAWSPLTKDFGNAYDGTDSGTQTFTFTNSGTATATGCSAPSLAGTNPGEFVISSDGCGTNTLAGSGATCTVVVKGHPNSDGVKTATLTRSCTFGGSASTTADQLVVNGISAVLAWTPLTKSFGDATVGTDSGTQTFTLTNSGTASATGCSAPALGGASPGEFAITTDNCGVADLSGGGATCTVVVKGHPTSTGTKTATLSRTCTVGGAPATTTNGISVNGVYPALAWSPLTKAFGSNAYAYGQSASVTFTFANTGTGPATGCSAPTLTGTDPSQFEISIDNCGTSDLAVGASCTVNVRTKISSAGAKAATLSRTCTVGNTTTTTANQITATGTANAPNLAVTAAFDQDSNRLKIAQNGFGTAVEDVVFGNSGTADATGCAAPVLGGTNPSEFLIVSHTCGSTLAAGDHCTVRVRGKPTSTATRNATISMACSVGGTPSLSLKTIGNGTTTPSQMSLGGYASLIRMSNGSIVQTGGVFPNNSSVLDSGTTATQVATGTDFACALRTGGTVKCWGSNTYGQLGDGTNNSAAFPGVTVSGLSGILAIGTGTGSQHACAVRSDNTVVCWGRGDSGQLGNGGTANSNVPVVATGVTQATQVTANPNATCARTYSGSGMVYCWGQNNYGQLGNGTTTNSSTPVQVLVSAGTSLQNAVNVNMGFTGTACVAMADGTAKCWGANSYGFLSGSNKKYATTLPSIANVTTVQIGFTNVCALISDGTVKCWGESGMGENGDGTNTPRASASNAVTVTGLAGATALYGDGWQGYCAVRSDNSVMCWGLRNRSKGDGGIASSNATATPLPSLSNVTQVTGTSSGNCALISDGTVKCWGSWASYEEAGHGFTSDYYVNVSTPTQVPGIASAVQIASASYTYCALISGGTVKCWGHGNVGQRGDGTWNDYDGTVYSTLGISTATQISGGSDTFCARLSDGTVSCWGSGNMGQMGDGTTNNQVTPQTVPGLTGVTSVAVGKYGTVCAIVTGGAVKCWGYNAHGELGNGTTTSSYVPVDVTGLTNATSLALGQFHSCALISDGTIRCWGDNGYGQLGDGTFTQRTTPVNAAWFSNATAITAGLSDTCALLADGRVRCWGINSNGQIGDGNAATVTNPSNAAVYSLKNVLQLTSGQNHHCALVTGGGVSCWGSNGSGIVDFRLRPMSGFDSGAVPSLAWSPASTDFGHVASGSSSSSITFTLTNSGGVSATGCSAPTLTNSTDFSLSADGCSTADLTAGSTCTVAVTANPASVGVKTTTLSRTCAVGGTASTTTDQIVVTATNVAQIYNSNLGTSPITMSVLSTGANNLLVVGVSWCCNANGATVTPRVTDNMGNTYVLAGTPVQDGGNDWVAIFYSAGSAAGVTSVSIAKDVGNSMYYLAGVFSEYAGIVAASPLDGYVTAAPNSTVGDSGALTPTQAGDLLVVVADNDSVGSTATAGTGFTLTTPGMSTVEGQGCYMEDRYYPGVSSVHGTFNFTASYPIPTAMAAFKHQ
ncbi:MAG: choice-of-anchor D domain-containing protein [Bdellovibrionales bacterium]|nr:choice-of-anchor D domain-containing protein [Bdellovibrionales bacterium]